MHCTAADREPALRHGSRTAVAGGDVEGIIVRQGAALRREQILGELTGLLELKEDEAPKASLERLFRKHPG